MSRWLHKAFDLRQVGDYRELVALNEEQVQEVVQWAQEFVSRVEAFFREDQEQERANAR